MNQRIIYEKPEGGVAILIPTPECLAMHTVEEIAAKDVPAGVPYKIINASDVPADRTFRDAWSADITEPDGVGAESNEFAEATE
jgi:hypothetical protein